MPASKYLSENTATLEGSGNVTCVVEDEEDGAVVVIAVACEVVAGVFVIGVVIED